MSAVPGRVLVVDDNKVIRQLIRVNLELEGFEVVTAADGAECLDVVHQVRPDVVTLDVVMPRLDGLRTAERLRADARTRDLPVVIISACTQYEVESGLEVGVDAFLAKPFEPSELVDVVRQLMGRRVGPDGRGGLTGHAKPAGQASQAGEASQAGHGLDPVGSRCPGGDGGGGGGGSNGLPGEAEPVARPGG
nr:response regulator [Streptomyces sp. NRRL S-920]